MDFYEVVRKRRSIRKYGPQPVEAAMLDRILDAGTRGPTGAYLQGQSYVLITDPPLVQRLMDERDRQERGFWVLLLRRHRQTGQSITLRFLS